MPLAPHVKNLNTSATDLAEPQEPQKSKKSQKSQKLKTIEISLAILNIWLVYWGVSKLAAKEGEKYVIPVKCILKPAMTPKPALPVDETKLLDLVFIGTTAFQYLAKQKDVEIFAISMQDIKNELNVISMKDIKYQLNKMAKTPTNPKTIIPKEYHKFLDVFSKKALDTLSLHSKYNQQISLLEKYKDHSNSPFSKMSKPKLQFMKKFLDEHLKKGFIKTSSAPCSLQIMLAAKPGGGIRFCIDYKRLNKLTKENAYLIPLIEETLAQLKNVKVFTKIDICQAFHKFRMATDSENYTTFASQFSAFK